MTRLGTWEFLALVAFWLSGLAAYIIGGLPLVGHVFQVFLWTVAGWIAWQIVTEYWDTLVEKYRQQVKKQQLDAAFKEWHNRRVNRLKGMD